MNIILILAVAILNFILGMVWYGPIFGKAWARVMGVSVPTKEEKNAMMKKMRGPMVLTLVGNFLTSFVLYLSISVGDILTGIIFAVILWLGFVTPVVMSGVIWDKMPRKTMFHKFLIQAGFYLLSFLVTAVIFGIFSR